jgi:hypothetical protein
MDARETGLGGVPACPPECDGRPHRGTTAFWDSKSQAEKEAAREWAEQQRLGQSTNAGLEQMTPALSGHGGPRTFTREEVLTVLKAYKALHAMTTQPTTVGCVELCAIFERME